MRSRKPPRCLDYLEPFTCLDEITVPKIFMAMVRPYLEYGNVIWHPRFQLDKTEIEKVQRRATKLIQPCDMRLMKHAFGP